MIALLPLLTFAASRSARRRGAKTFAGLGGEVEGKVICTLRLKAGEQISGEMRLQHSSGRERDLKEPEPTEHSDKPSPLLNAKLQGDTLTFERKTAMKS